MPAIATSTCSAVTTTNASPVPMTPRIAKTGTSTAADRDVPRPAVGPRASGLEKRSRITARWAIVNESIAPNAYMLPRNSALPGIIARQAIAPKIRIPIHGVP